MHTIRKLFLILASSVFSSLLILMVMAVSLNHIFGTPAFVKRSLAESGVYQKLVDDILDQSRNAAGEPQEGIQLPLERQEIKHAAKQSFSQELLQINTETVIDSFYAWMEGKTEKPEFQIDLSAAKKDFATRVGSYLRDRVADLPPCSPREIPNPYDPFTANCRPPGVNLEPEIQRLTAELQTTPDFLPDTVFNASDLDIGQISYLQDGFRLMRQAPFVIGLLIVIAAAGVVALSRPRLSGVRLLGRTAVLAGIFTLLGFWIFSFGLSFFVQQVASRPIHSSDFVQNSIISSLLESMLRSVYGVFITFSLLYIIGGALTIIAVRSVLKRRLESQEPVAGETGAKSDEPAPAGPAPEDK